MEDLCARHDTKAVYLANRPGNAYLVALQQHGQWLGAVYLPENKKIITFLPKHEFAHYQGFLDNINIRTGAFKFPEDDTEALRRLCADLQEARVAASIAKERVVCLNCQMVEPPPGVNPKEWKRMIGKRRLIAESQSSTLKRLIWQLERDALAAASGVGNIDNAEAMLRVAYKLICDLGARLNWDLSREERARKDLILRFMTPGKQGGVRMFLKDEPTTEDAP